MPGYVLGNFFIYAIINAFTPGPGNILALNTVTNYGYKKGRSLFFGIFAGYYVVQIICALFVYGVSAFMPNILGIMKYIGAAYILWLAIHIAVSKPESESTEKSASFFIYDIVLTNSQNLKSKDLFVHDQSSKLAEISYKKLFTFQL